MIAVQNKRLRMLLDWRKYLPLLAEAVGEVLAGAEVYVFGSALEGNLTVDSDIDVPLSWKEKDEAVARVLEVLKKDEWFVKRVKEIIRDLGLEKEFKEI
ncbi:MAG: nucleotidyltransferase domain-containing protein [Candidatus Bathyarchaeia archaeon]